MQLTDKEYARACSGGQVSHLNVGCGEDHTIRELAAIVSRVKGFEGRVVWDASRPDGMALKLLDVSRLSGLGWRPQIDLVEGIKRTYKWYCSQVR
jgi:GDP-L-fucose synthase